MRMNRRFLLTSGFLLLAAAWARAELLIVDRDVAPQSVVYVHPALRSVVFLSSESRGQAILPAPPVFVAPPPLIYRAPGPVVPLYPPASWSGFNRPGAPTHPDMAAYSLARAHAMSQDLYRRNGVSVYFGANPWLAPYLWQYPSVQLGQSHPSNRVNAIYLLDRAHRFSQDAYRKP